MDEWFCFHRNYTSNALRLICLECDLYIYIYTCSLHLLVNGLQQEQSVESPYWIMVLNS